MRVLCFSSFTFSYLDRARVLFATVRERHPDWRLVALITDQPPPGFVFDVASEPFDEAVFVQDLGIEPLAPWLFSHDVVEVCTAVKGTYLAQACASGAEAVVYLDPDIALFDSLDPVIAELREHSILLTPHQLEPDDERRAILDNEIGSLKHGIYNLGFVAVRAEGEGRRFANWWKQRLLDFCYDDIPNGLFTDQRWCDHVPSFFEGVKVLRDPGLNVASWNLSRRKVAIDHEGRVTVNGSPLRFWHFTKLGPIADAMTTRYAGENYEVFELWSWYKRQVAAAAEPAIPKGWWRYGAFQDGTPIERHHRRIYRERADLQRAFDDPFRSGPGTYHEWLRKTEQLEQVKSATASDAA